MIDHHPSIGRCHRKSELQSAVVIDPWAFSPSLYSFLSLPHRINFIYNCFDPFICYIHSWFDCESFFQGQ
ncbi:hypothetical protein HanPSC8_Chr12g0522201 [Helianthus annuus]|nr:hypothetical protein HanPSC8_Chr12g0522201 [Helianthus annuus]